MWTIAARPSSAASTRSRRRSRSTAGRSSRSSTRWRARRSRPSARSACTTCSRRSTGSARATRSRGSCPRGRQPGARADGGELRLGGVRVVGTCMFTDLRGSTQFAESLPPETVVDVINRYLSELTESILGHGGTLISYLGDGFMAVFGAPIEQEDHADRAARRRPRDPRRAAARASTSGCVNRASVTTSRSGSGSTPARSWPGTSAPRSGSSTRRWATRSTPPRGSRARRRNADFYVLIADSTREALVEPVGDLVDGRRGRRPRPPRRRITVWSIEAARKPERTAAVATAPQNTPA